ncbi:uncharacterized protein LOC143062823 [Mytilus galloprovincialis]|uniref:uncharacterized protein LOC143062823 n=1 Tax=Mytilus galloprovincialis TaxID=29158 RepID=UPI003F7B7365
MSISLKKDRIQYLYMGHLVLRVAPSAFSKLFDRHYNGGFKAALLKEKDKFRELKDEKIITNAQWQQLNTITDDDTDNPCQCLDTGLLLILVKSLTGIKIPPWRPSALDTSVGADLYRVEFYLNYIINKKEETTDDAEFYEKLKDVAQSIERLGGSAISEEQNQVHGYLDNDEINQVINLIQQQKDINSSEDPIPNDRRESINRKVNKWRTQDQHFVSTIASQMVMEKIRENACVVLTGESGNGKTMTSRHLVLQLNRDEGFEIVVIKRPAELVKFRRRFKKQVFIIDNFCGRFSADQKCIAEWAIHMDHFEEIFKSSEDLRFIMTCRKQVYNSKQFSKIFRNTKMFECKLLSQSFTLSKKEKRTIASKYIGDDNMRRLDEDIVDDIESFFLFCQLRNNSSVKNQVDFFKEPIRLLNTELQNMCDTDEWAFFILTLLVVFDNKLDKRLFHQITARYNRRGVFRLWIA